MDSYQKRRKPGYYSNRSKKPRNFTLEPGLKGFICTCNIREKDCIREAYNILNEYADQLYGNEKSRNWRERPEKVNEESDEEIETALSNEIESIKAESKKTVDGRRFQVVESGANNCLFIRTNLENPVELVQHILKDIETTKKQKTRFLLRMIPIEVTCKAYIDDIKEKVSVLLDKYFTKEEEKTFSIIINRRNSNMVSRDEAIAELAEMIKMRNINNRVDLKQPQLTVIIEVIRSMCCIGILPDYFRFRKYNLLELASPEGKKGEEDSAHKDSPGEPGLPEEEKASPCDSAGKVDASEETGTSKDSGVTEEKSTDDCNEDQSPISECQPESTDDTKNDIKSQSQNATTDSGAGVDDVTETGNSNSLSQKTENCAIDTK